MCIRIIIIYRSIAPHRNNKRNVHMQTTDSRWAYYALKPLATGLISNPSLPVRTYVSGKGFEGQKNISFSNIDLEVYAREFLSATDHFLNVLFPRNDEAIH